MFPSFKNLFDIFAAKLKQLKPDIDPTVKGSFAFAFGQGVAAVGYALVILVKQLLKQFFPQTATGRFLALWGSYEDLEQLDPTPGVGQIVVTGTDSTAVPALQTWLGNNGVLYQNTSSFTISDQTILIDTMTFSSGIVTVTTDGDHGLATGMDVVISGAAETDYNGTQEITVTASNQFTYPISGTPSSPATGSPQGDATFASVFVQAQTQGADTNLNSGSVLAYQGAVVGVGSEALTDFFGLQGGADQEDQEDFRARILLSRASQEGVFTNTQIELAAKLINGNTRVSIQNPNTDDIGDVGAVLPGQVNVYILRDNDTPITPSPTVLNQTKKSIIENGKLPANQWETDVSVLAPNLRRIVFDFTILDPDTGTMRNAVQSQLGAYFTDEVEVGTDLDNDVLRGVIIGTQDLTTGDFIESFNFTTNTFSVSDDELPVFGDLSVAITFSGTTATATAQNHGLQTGDQVTISGANETEYNGTFTVTVVDDNTFEYTMGGTPSGPATGSPILKAITWPS